MRIIDLLSEDRILLGASAQTKEQAIDQMVELQAKSGSLKDKDEQHRHRGGHRGAARQIRHRHRAFAVRHDA